MEKDLLYNIKYSSVKFIIYIGIRDTFCQSEHGLGSLIQIFFYGDNGGGDDGC